MHDGVREVGARLHHGQLPQELASDHHDRAHQRDVRVGRLEAREEPELRPELHPAGDGRDGVFGAVVDEEGVYGEGGVVVERSEEVLGEVEEAQGGKVHAQKGEGRLRQESEEESRPEQEAQAARGESYHGDRPVTPACQGQEEDDADGGEGGDGDPGTVGVGTRDGQREDQEGYQGNLPLQDGNPVHGDGAGYTA